jgi:uncharacterized membrane protein (DUF2068 family)
MDWNLYRCGRIGHITYAPEEPALSEYMHTTGPTGDLWQCLRCGTFVTGEPVSTGPATKAPIVKRGREIRSELILKVFAIERFLRFLLLGGVAIAIWQFRDSKGIQTTFNRDLPIVKTAFNQLGFNISHSHVLIEIRKALHFSPRTLGFIALGVGLFAVVEVIEGIGLWLSKRWGEYFAMIVTSLGLPYEIYDLTQKVTAFRLVLFAINLALVIYLVVTKRLFGVRGGRQAFEDMLRSESIFDEAAKLAQARRDEEARKEAEAAAQAEAEAQASSS